MPNQQGGPLYSPQGSMQGGGRNYGPPQNYPSQTNYGPPGQGERRDPMPMNAPVGQSPYQPGAGSSTPSYQGNYNQGGPGNFYPQQQREFPRGDQGNYEHPRQQGGFRQDYNYYGPTQRTNYGQGGGGYQGQGGREAYWQGSNAGPAGQGTNPGYGQSYPGQNQGQGFPQGEQRNVQEQQGNYPPTGQTGTNRVRAPTLTNIYCQHAEYFTI